MMEYGAEHLARWDRLGGQLVEGMRSYTLGIWQTYLPMIVRQRTGRLSGINTPARVATVALDSVANEAPVIVQAAFGQPAFPRSDVGRRILVWQRIEFRLTVGPAGRRVSITQTRWITDAVVGT